MVPPSRVGVDRGPLPKLSWKRSPSSTRQTSSPVAASKRPRNSLSASANAVNSLPSWRTKPVKPSPMSRRQTMGGPPSGHGSMRPVSGDRPVRSGPRNCGQSATAAGLSRRKARNSGTLGNVADVMDCCSVVEGWRYLSGNIPYGRFVGHREGILGRNVAMIVERRHHGPRLCGIPWIL